MRLFSQGGKQLLSSIYSGLRQNVFMTWIWYLFKYLPSPVGVLGSGASEPFQGVCSAALDSNVSADSSRTSKDCPVGFTHVDSVSVVDLHVPSSAWAAEPFDLTLWILELQTHGCQLLCLLGLTLLTLHHTVTSEGNHRTAVFYWLLTNNWQNISVCVFAWPTWTVPR